MIPKQIFFIWLGDNKPNYVDFAVKNFSDINPSFKIDLIEWKVNDIENPKDPLLIEAIDSAIKLNRKDRKFIQSVANIYRYTLLRKYGGIYLDCDTFPVRPFDDKLLNHTSFDVLISWGRNQFCVRDVFFMGTINLNDLEHCKSKNAVFLHPHTECGNYDELRIKFFNCELKYGEYYGDPNLYYINHYHDFTWNPKNLRTPLCKRDKGIEK